MLDAVDLDAKIPKAAYRPLKDDLIARLVLLQQSAVTNKVPAIVVFEGWEGAGKGHRISELAANLDPRAFATFVTAEATGDENRYPFMRRYWKKIGQYGTMTIFDRSWYWQATEMLREHAASLDKPKKKRGKQAAKMASGAFDTMPNYYGGDSANELEAFANSMVSFEKQFADDGYVIVKLFLHISKKEQLKRLKALSENKETSWRVTEKDFAANDNYKISAKILDELLEKTNFEYAPWTVVPANDWRLANIVVLRAIVEAYEHEFRKRGIEIPVQAPDFLKTDMRPAKDEPAMPVTEEQVEEAEDIVETSMHVSAIEPHEDEDGDETAGDAQAEEAPDTADDLIPAFPMVKAPTLDEVDHTLMLEEDDYHRQLDEQQERLSRNQMRLYRAKIAMILAFEGWDAAGKGGTIKRIARALDARDYRVNPSSSPTPPEKQHPFLWRYWTRLPKTGHIGIYDRTWYGRVLVERVEGFATNEQWRRAYDEINQFEWELTQWGSIICKFWLDISQDEQLARFEARRDNPNKSWKLTDEDWRNREKYPQYKVATDDMLRLTSTIFAPWHVIENDNKYYGRIKAIEIINDAIEERLG